LIPYKVRGCEQEAGYKHKYSCTTILDYFVSEVP
jgi:hypothetical protein